MCVHTHTHTYPNLSLAFCTLSSDAPTDLALLHLWPGLKRGISHLLLIWSPCSDGKCLSMTNSVGGKMMAREGLAGPAKFLPQWTNGSLTPRLAGTQQLTQMAWQLVWARECLRTDHITLHKKTTLHWFAWSGKATKVNHHALSDDTAIGALTWSVFWHSFR